jgi:hypothetical protein
MGGIRNAFFLVRKPEGRRQHGRHRRRWEENIRMKLLRKAGREVMNWTRIAMDSNRRQSLINMAMKLLVP